MKRTVPLFRETRDALGIDIENAVVIIDEAHNLLPAINGSHSVALPAAALAGVTTLLAAYLRHFQARLGTAKAAAVTAALRLAERLQAFVASHVCLLPPVVSLVVPAASVGHRPCVRLSPATCALFLRLSLLWCQVQSPVASHVLRLPPLPIAEL